MNRILPNLPALLVATALLIAAALLAVAPRALWPAVAGPLLMAVAFLVADVVDRRRRRPEDRSYLPSGTALLLATTFLLSCGIVGFADHHLLGAMLPILGSGAALPLLIRRGDGRASCRRA